ncbi:MAG TPA: AbgT family transporter [Salinivirgaceae bacterium]|nr:AbgT family transporter [Salinivirgaceae bacterium]
MENKRQQFNFLKGIERVGNAMPHPATLFLIFALGVLLLSLVGHWLGWQVTHPATGEKIQVINLFSREGLHRILLGMVDNYTGFAPLGIVMVAILGIGIAESSGLIGAIIRLLVLKSPAKLITFVIVLAGVLSNVASDLGYVLIIPLGGIIFHSMGRHPIAGLAAAFAGVSGGFSANLVIGTIDPLLAGLTTESARIIDPNYYVLPTANYYFMAASAILISVVTTWVTHRFVEPFMGKYQGDVKPEKIEQLSPLEKKALVWTSVATFVWLAIFVVGLYPQNGFLRSADGSLLHSPVLKGFIGVLFLVSTTLGIVYGVVVGKFKSDADVVNGMTHSFKTLVSFLVLVFFAAQFVAFFKWSNLGLVLAVKGASLLQQANPGFIPLIILFVLFAGILNLFMGSSSAKWAILGPVFVPIFMILGYSPELSQAIYRIGDSITNIISPMMSFFALIIVYFEKYDKNAGIGTLVSTMLPYTIAFFLIWTLFLILWVWLEIPLGPGAGIFYSPVN